MSDKIKITAEFSPSDRDYLNRYREVVGQLAQLVIEIMTTEQQLLLSPIFRQILLEKARELDGMHQEIRAKLVVDNPGRPLTVQP